MLGLHFVPRVRNARAAFWLRRHTCPAWFGVFSVEGQGWICADVGVGTRAEAQATGEGWGVGGVLGYWLGSGCSELLVSCKLCVESLGFGGDHWVSQQSSVSFYVSSRFVGNSGKVTRPSAAVVGLQRIPSVAAGVDAAGDAAA